MEKRKNKKSLEEKRMFKDLMKKKQNEKRKESKRNKKLKREADIWKFINKKRSKRTWKETNIGKHEWRGYFMELLDGRGGQDKQQTEQRKEKKGEELKEEEIRSAVNKMKVKAQERMGY